MSTAIIGVGNLGRVVADHLVTGGERVVLAARDVPEVMAKQLGTLATAATVPEAIDSADVVIFAVAFDVMEQLIRENMTRLAEKVVVDPSNAMATDDKGEWHRTLPDGVSAGSVIAGLLPETAHYVKAFGTLSAGSLEKGASRRPQHAVLFYATDDKTAQSAVELLISRAGFDPLRAGGVGAAGRIEMGGDLHEFGGLNGRLVDVAEAQAAVRAGS